MMSTNGIREFFNRSGISARSVKAAIAAMALTGFCLGCAPARHACDGDGCGLANTGLGSKGAAAPSLSFIPKAEYGSHSPAELVTYSYRSPSDSEKTAVRAYLAKNYPESAAGLFARAWLAVYERNDKAAGVDLLKRCLAINPKNLYCLSNMAAYSANAGEKAAAYNTMLQVDDSFEFYSEYFYLYLVYLNELKDKPAADKLLADLRAKHPDSPVLHEIEAVLHDGKPDEAKTQEALYERAIGNGAMDFDLNKRLADLRFDELSKKEPEKRGQALRGMLEYATYVEKTDPSRVDLMQQAFHYIATRFAQTSEPAGALMAYVQAFKLYPTPEIAVEAYDAILRKYAMDTEVADAAFKFLLAADRTLPDSPVILGALGKRYAALNQVEKARQYLERAVAYSVTDKDRVKATTTLVQTVYEDLQLDFDKACDVLKKEQKGLAQDNVAYGGLLLALYVDRVDAGKFQEALTALDTYETYLRKHGPVNDFWFDDRRRQILGYLDDSNPAGGKGIDQLKRIGPIAKNTLPVQPNTSLAVSPDGRRMVLGSYPMQLWDIQNKTKIADLGRGTYAKFSPNGRYIAASSNFTAEGNFTTHELIVYDAASGKVRARDVAYAGKSGILDFAWNPAGTQIVYAGDGIGPTIYDVGRNKRVRKAAAPGNTVVTAVAWTRGGKIITGQAMADHLLVWDANKLTVTRQLPGVDWPHALALTSDSRYLAALDNQRVLSVWDTKTWKLRQAGVSAWGPHSMAAHPSAHIVLLGEKAPAASTTITAFDLDTMKPAVSRDLPWAYSGAAYSKDGKHVYRATVEGIGTLDASTLEPRSLLQSAKPDKAVADTRNGYFVTYGSDGIRVWDVKDGTRKGESSFAAEKLYAMAGDTGQFIARASYQTDAGSRVLFFDPSTLQTRDLTMVNGKIGAVASAPGLVAIAHFGHERDNEKLGQDFTGDVDIIDANSGKVLHQIKVQICTEPVLAHGFMTAPGFEKISLSRDGTQVMVLTSWTDGFSTGTVFSKQIRIFNTNSGKLQYAVDAYKDISSAWFDEQDRDLVHIVTDSGSYVYHITAGKEVSRNPLVRTGMTSLPLAKGRGEVRYGQTFIEWRDAKGAVTYLRQPDNLAAVAVFEDADRMAVLNYANEVSFYELPK